MTRDEQIRQVEDDRRERESALMLLLLSFAGRARLNIERALRVGAVWTGVLRGTLLGDERIDQRGAVTPVARVLADSHLAGYERAGLLVSFTVPRGGMAARFSPADARVAIVPAESFGEATPLPRLLVDAYADEATAVLTRAADTLQAAIELKIASVGIQDRIAADVAAVDDALVEIGWSPEKPFNVSAVATAEIMRTFGAGMGDGYRTPEVAAVTEGFVFDNPADDRSTSICFARAGVMLPPSHPWWTRSYPPLHRYGCRSMVLPLTRKFEPTTNPPEYPLPDPGYGRYAGFLSNAAYP